MGTRLRRVRTARGMGQHEFAELLDLSPSYYNQLENDRRPLTATVRERLARAGVDLAVFDPVDDSRALGELREAVLPYVTVTDAPALEAQLRTLVRSMPDVAAAVQELHRRWTGASDQLLDIGSSGGRSGTALTPHEEVRDFFSHRHNHFSALDTAAERTVEHWGLVPGTLEAQLTRLLYAVHGIEVRSTGPGSDDLTTRRRYDARAKVLQVAAQLSPSRRAFQMATQLALIAHHDDIESIVAEGTGLSGKAKGLARIGLAHYFAGAVLLPYGPFLAAAERCRYDIDVLSAEFAVGFETVCHRLSTLQREGARGVPFFFVRTDRAGNISKRQSATSFHFSRSGGSCPLWIVHEAFETPGRLRRQIAQMPDGRTYLWIARTVSGQALRFRSPQQLFAVGLGCDIRHAHRLIYSDGLDLTDRHAATPIGPGCRTCERSDCVQRAFPQLSGSIDVDPDTASVVPYRSTDPEH